MYTLIIIVLKNVEPSVRSFSMFPETKPSRGSRPCGLSSGEFNSCQNSNVLPLILRQTVVPPDGVRGDNEGVVELGAVGVLATLDTEGVCQAASQVQLGCQVAVDVPGEPGGRKPSDARVAFHVAGGAHARVEGSQGRVEQPEGTPGGAVTGDWARRALFVQEA
jgi:hypothetical protein